MHIFTWANFSDKVTFGKLHYMVLHYLGHMQQVHGHSHILHMNDGEFSRCCVGPKDAPGSLRRVS